MIRLHRSFEAFEVFRIRFRAIRLKVVFVKISGCDMWMTRHLSITLIKHCGSLFSVEGSRSESLEANLLIRREFNTSSLIYRRDGGLKIVSRYHVTSLWYGICIWRYPRPWNRCNWHIQPQSNWVAIHPKRRKCSTIATNWDRQSLNFSVSSFGLVHFDHWHFQ